MDHARPPVHIELETTHLDLRRLQPHDVDRPELAGALAESGGDLRDGYCWLAESKQDGRPVGVGGVRRTTGPGAEAHQTLSCYLDPAARGRGLGREIAGAAMGFAYEWLPDLPVRCELESGDPAAVRTAARVGMLDLGDGLLHGPVVLTGAPLDPAARDELVDLWDRVNTAGGAVGFEPGAQRATVADTLDGHLAACADGTASLVRLAEPTRGTGADPSVAGRVLGFGFVNVSSAPVVRHRATLVRVMVDTDLQGRGIGRLLLSALHARARLLGREMVEIGYRGGTGLGGFYGSAGYTEVGRVPRGLRFAFGERDDVRMARRLDGSPLRAKGA